MSSLDKIFTDFKSISVNITFAPASERAIPAILPIPLPEPVTNAVFPSSLKEDKTEILAGGSI